MDERPDFRLEQEAMARGAVLVAGVDEAGRGPLAGPVVAAAVILDPLHIPDGLNDSKKLTQKRREVMFDAILTSCIAASWHCATAATIDRVNILQASLHAMQKAVYGLSPGCDHALIDGRDVPAGLSVGAQSIIKGDARSLSIAAASIIAKVMRDRMMIRAGDSHPLYGFSGHKGYGSSMHMSAIADHGATPLHRMSFAPLRQDE